MLSEIFSELEIEDEISHELPFCRPEDFKPMIHSKNWFQQELRSDVETLPLRAYDAYHKGNFSVAFELFNKHLSEGEHNRVHKVGIYESIIRSSLKMEPLPSKTEELLRSYKNLANEYGDQLQYWNSAALVYQKMPNRNSEYLKTVIMLCSTVDSPDHWTLFGENPYIHAGPNFKLAYLTRILSLFDYNLELAAGFVVDSIKERKKKAENRLADLNETDERIALAKKYMVTDLLRSDKLRELGDDVKRPAHDCRCKVGIFKTDEMIESIVSDFVKRYDFMFVGMSLHGE